MLLLHSGTAATLISHTFPLNCLIFFKFEFSCSFSCSNLSFLLLLFLWPKSIQERLVVVVQRQSFQVLINLTLNGGAAIIEASQSNSCIISSFLEFLQGLIRLCCLLLDLREELKETTSVSLQHFFWAEKTDLSHLIDICQPFNFSVLGLEHHLN